MSCKAFLGQLAPHTDQKQHRVLVSAINCILQRYWDTTPTAKRLLQDVFTREGGYGADQVYHDHLAFRTFGVEGMGLESLGAAFESFGYQQQDWYTFPTKHLFAAWYAPPPELYEVLPRLFISQLQVEKLSRPAQAVIRATCEAAGAGDTCRSAGPKGGAAAALGPSCRGGWGPTPAWTSALLGELPWPTPSAQEYQLLAEESEYGAWVLVNGYGLNHSALSVHRIQQHSGDIYAFANQLVTRGYDMNSEGGIIKVSPDAGLLQCSILSDMRPFTFREGQVLQVPGAYLEFVERKPAAAAAATGQPQAAIREAQRRDGFEAASANHIFASTTLAAERAAAAAGSGPNHEH